MQAGCLRVQRDLTPDPSKQWRFCHKPNTFTASFQFTPTVVCDRQTHHIASGMAVMEAMYDTDGNVSHGRWLLKRLPSSIAYISPERHSPPPPWSVTRKNTGAITELTKRLLIVCRIGRLLQHTVRKQTMKWKCSHRGMRFW